MAILYRSPIFCGMLPASCLPEASPSINPLSCSRLFSAKRSNDPKRAYSVCEGVILHPTAAGILIKTITGHSRGIQISKINASRLLDTLATVASCCHKAEGNNGYILELFSYYNKISFSLHPAPAKSAPTPRLYCQVVASVSGAAHTKPYLTLPRGLPS